MTGSVRLRAMARATEKSWAALNSWGTEMICAPAAWAARVPASLS